VQLPPDAVDSATVRTAGVPLGRVVLPFTDTTVLWNIPAFGETYCGERPRAEDCAAGIVSVICAVLCGPVVGTDDGAGVAAVTGTTGCAGAAAGAVLAPPPPHAASARLNADAAIEKRNFTDPPYGFGAGSNASASELMQ
jgi:hypothetical protein